MFVCVSNSWQYLYQIVPLPCKSHLYPPTHVLRLSSPQVFLQLNWARSTNDFQNKQKNVNKKINICMEIKFTGASVIWAKSYHEYNLEKKIIISNSIIFLILQFWNRYYLPRTCANLFPSAFIYLFFYSLKLRIDGVFFGTRVSHVASWTAEASPKVPTTGMPCVKMPP